MKLTSKRLCKSDISQTIFKRQLARDLKTVYCSTSHIIIYHKCIFVCIGFRINLCVIVWVTWQSQRCEKVIRQCLQRQLILGFKLLCQAAYEFIQILWHVPTFFHTLVAVCKIYVHIFILFVVRLRLKFKIREFSSVLLHKLQFEIDILEQANILTPHIYINSI